jgi:hypothetical protein
MFHEGMDFGDMGERMMMRSFWERFGLDACGRSV